MRLKTFFFLRKKKKESVRSVIKADAFFWVLQQKRNIARAEGPQFLTTLHQLLAWKCLCSCE
jgi:hypothetical protein